MLCIKLLGVFNGLLIFGNGLPIEESHHDVVGVPEQVVDVPIGFEHTFVDAGVQGVDAGHTFIELEFQGVDAGHTFVEPETEHQGVDAGHTFIEPEFQGVDAGHTFVEPEIEIQGVDAGHTFIEPEFQGVDAGHTFVEPETEFQGVDAGHTFIEPEFQGVDAGHTFIEPEFQGVDAGHTFVELAPEDQKLVEKDAKNDDRSNSTIYFESIPVSERPAFLRYHLAMALKGTDSFNPFAVMAAKESHTFETEVVEPDNFTMKLYQWMKNYYDITDDDLYNFVTFGQICFPSGTCIDPDDVGAICCPF